MKEHTSSTPAPCFFVVSGHPQTKNKRRAYVVGGVARVVRDPKSKDKQAGFQAVAQAHEPEQPWGGGVELSLGFYFVPPKSWPVWKKDDALRGAINHSGKPDLSRLVIFAEDCLSGLFFIDDAQVKAITTSKAWSLRPRTEVLVTYLPTNPASKAESKARLT